jgi:Tol biopolymer transport system component
MPKAGRMMVAVLANLACVSGSCVSAVRPTATFPRRPILYQSQAPGGTEDLRMLAPQTRISSVLLRGDSISSRGLAAWSPDAQRVAYVREYGTHDELFVLDVRTGAERRLGESSLPAAVLFPDWSPDGKRIAVSAGRVASHVGVFLVDVATGRAREVRGGTVSYRCPSWAPRGDRLVVGAYTRSRSALLVLDTAGLVLDTLIKSDTVYLDCPQWSPREQEILLTVFHGSGLSGWERPAFHSNLAVLSLEQRTVRQLTHHAGLTNYGRWSSDGQWVVFQSDRSAPPTTDAAHVGRMLQNLEIYILRRDGAGLRRVTTNTYFDAHPSW